MIKPDIHGNLYCVDLRMHMNNLQYRKDWCSFHSLRMRWCIRFGVLSESKAYYTGIEFPTMELFRSSKADWAYVILAGGGASMAIQQPGSGLVTVAVVLVIAYVLIKPFDYLAARGGDGDATEEQAAA